VRAEAPDGGVPQANLSGRRPIEAADDLQERALAGAVRADDGDDLAVVDPERYAAEGGEAAELLCERINLEEQTSPPGLRAIRG
jgi:hypothetical protein